MTKEQLKRTILYYKKNKERYKDNIFIQNQIETRLKMFNKRLEDLNGKTNN